MADEENWDIFIIGDKRKLIKIRYIIDACYENIYTLPVNTQAKIWDFKEEFYKQLKKYDLYDVDSTPFRLHLVYDSYDICGSDVVENMLDQIAMHLKGIECYAQVIYSDTYHKNRRLFTHVKFNKHFCGMGYLPYYTTKPRFRKRYWMPEGWFTKGK